MKGRICKISDIDPEKKRVGARKTEATLQNNSAEARWDAVTHTTHIILRLIKARKVADWEQMIVL
jgi:hypothetical protein